MPYNPGIQYRGDEFLFRAISGLGEDVAKGVERYRSEKQESQFLDGAFEAVMPALAQHAQAGKLTPEDLRKFDGFSGKSLGAKRGLIAQAGFLAQQLGQAQDRELRQRQADANIKAAEATQRLYERQVTAQEEARKLASERDQKMAAFARELFAGTRTGAAMPTPGGLVPLRREIGPEVIARAAANAGIMDDGILRALMDSGNRDQFMPQEVTLPGGRKAMTTSRGSAVPLSSTSEDKDADINRLLQLRQQILGTMAQSINKAANPEIERSLKVIDKRLGELGVQLGGAEGAGTGKVLMTNPKGQTVEVPLDQVPMAREKGYK